MSQRLADVAVVGSGNGYVRRHMSDPYWTTPLGYTKKGKPFYPMAGADGTDGSNGETGGAGGTGTGSGSGSEGGNSGGGTGDAGAGGNNSGAGDKDKTETVSKSDFDALMARMQAADRNKSEAEKKLRELEEKDMSEQEKVLKRVPELEQSVAKLTEENKGLKAKVAFLGLDGFSWNDPDIALGQVDLSEALKDDGETIDKAKLKKAADKLAADKPFLVKSAADGGGKDGKDGKGAGSGGTGGQGSSGSAAGSGTGGAGNNGAMSDEALRKKYPALN